MDWRQEPIKAEIPSSQLLMIGSCQNFAIDSITNNIPGLFTHTCTWTHTHTCRYIDTYTNIHTRTHLGTHTHAHTHTHIHTYTHLCTHIHEYTCIDTYACAHAHTLAYMCTHTSIHVHTHVHAQVGQWERTRSNASTKCFSNNEICTICWDWVTSYITI